MVISVTLMLFGEELLGMFGACVIDSVSVHEVEALTLHAPALQTHFSAL